MQGQFGAARLQAPPAVDYAVTGMNNALMMKLSARGATALLLLLALQAQAQNAAPPSAGADAAALTPQSDHPPSLIEAMNDPVAMAVWQRQPRAHAVSVLMMVVGIEGALVSAAMFGFSGWFWTQHNSRFADTSWQNTTAVMAPLTLGVGIVSAAMSVFALWCGIGTLRAAPAT
jgi:hypothetical protein